MPRCIAKKKDGKRCTKNSCDDSEYCKQHHDMLNAHDEEVVDVVADETPIMEDFHDVDVIPSTPVLEDTQDAILEELQHRINQLIKVNDELEKNNNILEGLYNDVKMVKDKHSQTISELLAEIKTEKTNHNSLKKTHDKLKATKERQSTTIKELKEEIKILKSDNDTNKPKKKREYKNVDFLAKFVLYHMMKEDEAVVKELHDKLSTLGLILKKQVKVGDTVVEKDIIPWMYIKHCADMKFSTMNEEEKHALLEKTKEKYGIV